MILELLFIISCKFIKFMIQNASLFKIKSGDYLINKIRKYVSMCEKISWHC